MIISDTAGRPWRIGQTDHAIGVSGVSALEDYVGVRDAYGNELQVTVMAVADELAAAADLVKGKLRGRPVAVVRGLGLLLGRPIHAARELLRDPARGHVRLRQPGGGAGRGAGSHGAAASLSRSW